jgi:NADPH-dependent ferric siderophore reductase
MIVDDINHQPGLAMNAPPRPEPAPPATHRRIERVRFELRRRELVVAQVERPTPGFAAITLAGPALEGFQSLSFDDHVKLMLPQPDGTVAMRDITPRAFDAARHELRLEIALHGHGPASVWAAQAAPGQTAVIGGPRGSMIIPTDHDWHLLAGDASALPAILRRLDELPAGTRAQVLVQVDDAADERPLRSAAGLQVQWVRTPAQWLEQLRDRAWPGGDGFVWLAGEAATVAQARRIVLEHHQHPRETLRAAAYWKQGAQAFHERLEEPGH